MAITTNPADFAAPAFKVGQKTKIVAFYVFVGIVAMAIAFAVGYAVIAWLLRYLRTGSYLPFVAYRLGLAALIVALLVTGTITAT